MCRNITPKESQILCSRCGNVANPTDGWEHGWPNYGHIRLGIDCCSMDALTGDAGISCSRNIWHDNHPMMEKFDAQEVVFTWGNGYEYDTVGKYRLCHKCQRELISIIGAFFKFPEMAVDGSQNNHRMHPENRGVGS